MTYQNLGYWIGQANDLSTGSHPSGWTSGQRWSETASEWQVMYNSMSADATTWHGRADQAWGPSRVWGSGESWEQAYNRVLPPAGVLVYDTALTATGAFTRGIWTAFGGSWTVPISGYYALYAECVNLFTNSNNDSIDYAYMRFVIGGTPSTQGTNGHRYSIDTPSQHSVFSHVLLSAGQVVTVQVNHSANQSGTTAAFGNATLKARFMPTQANPH
jgi:hypothetical protein